MSVFLSDAARNSLRAHYTEIARNIEREAEMPGNTFDSGTQISARDWEAIRSHDLPGGPVSGRIFHAPGSPVNRHEWITSEPPVGSNPVPAPAIVDATPYGYAAMLDDLRKLPRYSSLAGECVKCGVSMADTHYTELITAKYGPNGYPSVGRMTRTCKCCKHMWFERPMDIEGV
jgi:hypothetical protein